MPRTPPDAETLIRARGPEYWLELNPGLHVTDRPFASGRQPFAVDAARVEQAAEQLRIEGYSQLDTAVPRSATEPLAAAVGRVVAAGFPGALTIVYDEIWSLFARLSGVFEPIFGASYSVFPDLWIYHVDGETEKAGWSIHRDDEMDRWSLSEDGAPQLLTLWIPLTDATLDNSCIYVLPTHRDPNYPDRLAEWSIPAGAEADVRALPAEAGSVLLWNQYLLHWGARRNRRATGPRISLAIYVQSNAVPPFGSRPPAEGALAHETPAPRLVDLSSPLPFEDRLGSASRMVWKYRDLVPYPRAVLDFCREHAERYTARSTAA